MLKHKQLQKDIVINQIVSIFKYKRLFIEYEIEEMLFTNVLSSVYGETGHGSNYKLKITDLGNFLLDNFMSNFTYLEQIINNTPLPQKLRILKFIPQFDSSIKKHEWIPNYMENVLYFVLLINHVENIEKKSFAEYMEANPNNENRTFDKNQYGFHPIANKVASDAMATIKRIIKGAFEYEEQAEIKRHIISWLEK